MELHLIERWANEVIARLKSGQPLEDARVELKSSWIDADKAAWRIAAHANAAYGAEILWLIGVDEDKGVCGVKNNELANWFRQVSSYFDDEVYPTVTDLILHVEDVTVVALVFETKRAPFVIKNPDPKINRAVPWRSGTSLRSAQRSELLSMLSQTVVLPTAKLLRCELEHSSEDKDMLSWQLRAEIYFHVHTENHVILPLHSIRASLQPSFEDIQIELPIPSSSQMSYYNDDSTSILKTDSENVTINKHDVILKDSGSIECFWYARSARLKTSQSEYGPIVLNIEWTTAGSNRPITINKSIPYRPWAFKLRSDFDEIVKEREEEKIAIHNAWSLPKLQIIT